MAGRDVGSTFVEDQREFVEHFHYGKHIGKILDVQKQVKTSPGPKTHFVGI